jgi:hypothetical protein
LTQTVVLFEVWVLVWDVVQNRLGDGLVSGTGEVEVDPHTLPILHPDGLRERERVGEIFVPDFRLATWAAVSKVPPRLYPGLAWCPEGCPLFVVCSEQSFYG